MMWTPEDEEDYESKRSAFHDVQDKRAYALIIDALDSRKKAIEYYNEHGLPRVRMDRKINNIEDFVIASEIAFDCTISMDNNTRLAQTDNRYRVMKLREYAKNHPTLYKLGIGCPPFPKPILCYYTIKGGRGECEEVYESGLDAEDLKFLGWTE